MAVRGPATPPGGSKGVRNGRKKGRRAERPLLQTGLAAGVLAVFAIWRLFLS